jgi:hypothetical protein
MIMMPYDPALIITAAHRPDRRLAPHTLRRHHADTHIVPMPLIRDAYRAEILGGLGSTAGHDRAELR